MPYDVGHLKFFFEFEFYWNLHRLRYGLSVLRDTVATNISSLSSIFLVSVRFHRCKRGRHSLIMDQLLLLSFVLEEIITLIKSGSLFGKTSILSSIIFFQKFELRPKINRFLKHWFIRYESNLENVKPLNFKGGLVSR